MKDLIYDAYVIYVDSIQRMPLYDDVAKRNAGFENLLRDAITLAAHDCRLSLKDFGLPECRGAA